MTIVDDIRFTLRQHLTPAVRMIFIANVGIYLLTLVLSVVPPVKNALIDLLAFSPQSALSSLLVWKYVTYMFVHGGVFHILFNMMILWFMGPELERRLGTRFFWIFYLGTGIGAGLLHALVTMATGTWGSSIIGASGALYGVLLAYGCYWPDRQMLLYMVVPVKMKYLVAIVGAMAFFSSIGAGGGGGVAHLTHLTGLIFGYLLLAWHHRNFDLRRWRWQY